MNISALEKLIVAALEDLKGRDIEVIQTQKLTPLFERIIIASGDSNRHVRSLAEHVQEKAKEAGVSIISSEGQESGEWVLVDLGDIVVHTMQAPIRSFYNLEELWGGKGPERVRKQLIGQS